MVNATWFEKAPKPLLTDTCAVPAVVRNAVGIVAAIWAAWIRLGVIVCAVLFGGVKDTVAVLSKFVPAIVIAVAELFTGSVFGVTELTVGVRTETVKLCITVVAAA